jgi:DNA-binding NarL/FixJ family response regulator
LQRVKAVLLNIAGRTTSDGLLCDEIASIAAELAPAPVIILADGDNLSQTLKVIEQGARGFIPTSVGIEVCVEAIALGCCRRYFHSSRETAFAASIRSTSARGRGSCPHVHAAAGRGRAGFRKGKANKIIAYELNLRESTVKVHIRNIMKKLKATNRTEVAYKLNDLFQSDTRWKAADFVCRQIRFCRERLDAIEQS